MRELNRVKEKPGEPDFRRIQGWIQEIFWREH